MSVLTSLKSMAAATLSLIGSAAVAQPNADIDPPSVQPVNFEAAYRSANQVASIGSGAIYNINNPDNDQQEPFKIPKKEDLSMTYSVDPLTVSEGAKNGQYPLFPLSDGSVGVSVTPLSEMSDNTPKEFFNYVKYYFNSGVVDGKEGERSYDGYAHTHIAIAVDPDNPASVAKIKQLNEMLTAKIMGDPKNNVAGWAETYGGYVDAIVPIYIDDQKSTKYSDAFFAYKDVILKDGDMIGVIGNHPALLDTNGEGFQDIERFSILMEEVLKAEVHLLTRAEYEQKNFSKMEVVGASPIGFVDTEELRDESGAPLENHRADNVTLSTLDF